MKRLFVVLIGLGIAIVIGNVIQGLVTYNNRRIRYRDSLYQEWMDTTHSGITDSSAHDTTTSDSIGAGAY